MLFFFKGQVVIPKTADPLSRWDDARPLENSKGNGRHCRRFVGATIEFLGSTGQRKYVQVGVDQTGYECQPLTVNELRIWTGHTFNNCCITNSQNTVLSHCHCVCVGQGSVHRQHFGVCNH